MSTNSEGWTDERVGTLKELWLAGVSASGIADRLGGVSRNAVIGKVHRLGLPHRITVHRWSGQRRRPAPPRKPVPWRDPAALARRKAVFERAEEHQQVQAGPDLFIPPAERKHLIDLEKHDCRWAYGTGTSDDPYYFCGKPKVLGSSWCEFHNKRGTIPVMSRGSNLRNIGRPLHVVGAAPGIDTRMLPEFDEMERA